jgi:hypothetical protein
MKAAYRKEGKRVKLAFQEKTGKSVVHWYPKYTICYHFLPMVIYFTIGDNWENLERS